MIVVRSLCKSYRDADTRINTFDNISFNVDRGETIALMGQSGAGKSTLLHLLGGFDQVDSGNITIGDACISSMSDRALSAFRRRHLGMVFQQFNLIPSLSALDNISFVRRLNGMTPEDEYTQAIIDVLKLGPRLAHLPSQLSGGERQRVAIARALAARPDIILADEPTGNLDEHTAVSVMEQLMEVVRLHNSTLLLVTHSDRTASYLDKVWRLEQGQLLC